MSDRKKNLIIYIGVFLIPIAVMLIHMALKSCYPFGDNTILYGDGKDQYIYFYRMLSDIVSEHGSLMYNIDSGMGMDMYANFWYYLANPLTWLVILFGKSHVEMGLVTVLLIETGGCAVTAYFYFTHTRLNKMDCGYVRNLFCAVCALAYAMCDYILAYQFNIMWLPCLMLIPLVMYGIECMFYDNKYKLYMITLFLSFIFNFYFSWFACIFAVIWFVDQTAVNIKEKVIKFLKFAGASILSAMSAAFVLVPCYITALGRSGSEGSISDYSSEVWGNIADFFQGFLWGHEADLNGNALVVNNLYCGMFVIFLFSIYIFNKSIPIYRRIKRILEIVIMVIVFSCVYSIVALQGFHYTVAYNSRFMFMLIIILIVTAMEGIGEIGSVRYSRMAVSAALLVIFYVVMLICTENVVDIAGFMVSVMIPAYFMICLILYKRKSIKYKSYVMNIVIVGALEIISNPFFALENAYTVTTDKLASVDSWGADYETIDSSKGNRKTSWMYDGANLFYYSETSLFSSCSNSSLINYGRNLGMNYLNNGGTYTYKGTTPLVAMLYNVRYVLTEPRSMASYGGYSEVNNKGYYGIYESAYAIGASYMMPEEVLEWEYDSDNPFNVQNDMTRDVLKCGDIFTELDMSDIEISGNKCVVDTDNSDIGSVPYINIDFDSEETPMYVVISYDVISDDDIYAYIGDDYNIMGYCIYIDGELREYSNRVTASDMVHVGNVKAGDKVDILIMNGSSLLDEGTTYYMLYSFNDDVMTECKDKLSDEVMEFDTYEDTHISGKVDVYEDGILYISIPYSRGFTAYVDGERADIVKIGDTMMGIRLSEGSHKVELKYITYGLIPGVIISLTGMVLIALICIYKRKRRS